jgi:hypothetical protein
MGGEVMIKAEILVGQNKYQIDFPEGKNLEEVYNYTLSVAMGNEVHKGPDGWLDLNKRGYDHIRVWEEKPQVDPLGFDAFRHLPPNIKQAEIKNPTIIRKPINYLGQKVDLEVAEYIEAGVTTYVLPYKVGGVPAASMLSQKSLEMVGKLYCQDKPFSSYEIVLPHGPIADDQEALAFVKDYAEETAAGKEKLLKDTDKTARGFSWPKE